MALDPLEWIAILAIVAVIFLWGPQKIPEIARTIGKARKEFESYTKEFQKVTSEMRNPTSFIDRVFSEPAAQPPNPTPQPQQAPPATQPPPSPTYETRTPDQILIDSAKKLGITTEGKTKQQISDEVLAKSKSPA